MANRGLGSSGTVRDNRRGLSKLIYEVDDCMNSYYVTATIYTVDFNGSTYNLDMDIGVRDCKYEPSSRFCKHPWAVIEAHPSINAYYRVGKTTIREEMFGLATGSLL